MKKPELLAPGGSFLSAYYAFEAGADGVYLGLKEFSARKAAQNFSMEQLRRIRQLALERGRRIYIAINTVVLEPEISRLSKILALVEALGVDGVIVQDLGVYDLIARQFPRIPIHASTQMAVHNDAGLRMAEDLGIRRVILSRELPLRKISELRERHPRIELEVFIHGALCYSFSGVCLASSTLTGRSGNRGDCAQICRSLFCDESAPSARRNEGAIFSCRDLFLGREVLKLAEIGIDGLKIEGRMKSPEYVFNVTRLYREILDRGETLPEEEYRELVRRAELSFSREKTTGWLHAASGSDLVDRRFPGHRGSLLGTVDAVQGREISIRLAADLSLRDGLGFFASESRLVAFSVMRIRKADPRPSVARRGVGGRGRPSPAASGGVGGRKADRVVKFARAGEIVSVEVPREASDVMPARGAEIRHLSSRFLDLPHPKEAGFPLYKVPLDLEVSVAPGGIFTARASGFPPFTRNLTIDRAARKKPFAEILAHLLAESGDSLFTPGKLSLLNQTGLDDDGIFVPPSELKKVKNELYAFLDAAFQSSIDSKMDRRSPGPVETRSPLALTDLEALAQRNRMTPCACSPIPFVCGGPASGASGADFGDMRAEDLFLHAGLRWLPLPPIILDDGRWLEALRRLLDSNPEARFAIGLNNLSHLAFAAGLADRSNAWFFGDFYLYAANARTLSLLRERVPRLLFVYSWIEGDDENHGTLVASAGAFPVIRLSPDFRPPLFYSLGCFARHVLNNGSCRDDCPRDFTRDLRQGKNRLQLVVRDCVTYLF